MKTKIIATISKVNGSIDLLADMIKAGADIFRINMSHASHEDVLELIERIRLAEEKCSKPVEIMVDLAGPELRLLSIETPVTCNQSTMLELHKTKSLSIPEVFNKLSINDRMLLQDGKFEGSVVSITKETAVIEVNGNGTILPNAHISFPEIEYGDLEITEKDKTDLIFADKVNADYLALSFIHSKADVQAYRDFLKLADPEYTISFLPKFESRQSLKNIDEIVEAGDCFFIARGDMGTENPMDLIPYYQKLITAKCRKQNKPVFVATQMLSSMEDNPLPTRAEVSDIANAVIDGVTALTLSGETAIGKYPVESVKQMRLITDSAENYRDEIKRLEK